MADADRRVLVVGVSNLETSVPVDEFPVRYVPARYPRGEIRTRVAGVSYNVAAALRALGVDVILATYVGQDAAGSSVRARLGELGLLGPTAVTTGRTPQSVVLVARSGERMVNTDLDVLPDAVYPARPFEEALGRSDLAVITNIGFSRPLLSTARSRGVPIACDVHAISDLEDPYNADFMAAATVLFCSHERLPCPPEEWAGAVLGRYGCRIVVVGLGADGCLVAERGGPVAHVPAARPSRVVSTAGAGDALCAAFLEGWRRGLRPVDAAGRAVVFAAGKVGSPPGIDGFMTLEELDRRLSAVEGLRDLPLG